MVPQDAKIFLSDCAFCGNVDGRMGRDRLVCFVALESAVDLAVDVACLECFIMVGLVDDFMGGFGSS
jgi:hypothetical protein